MSKFSEIITLQTNGSNYGVYPEDIVEKLTEWDALYGVEISHVDHSAVLVTFSAVPEDCTALAEEAYEFCPDIIDQGFDSIPDMLEMSEEYGHEVPEDVLELIEGEDLTADDIGMRLFSKSLKTTHVMALWWD